MDRQFTRHGHKCTVESVAAADPTACSNADLICVGSWTQGFFFFHQHPTRQSMCFINRLGNLEGKKAIVFCTFRIATGSLLPRMAKVLEDKGAQIVGQFKFRGAYPGNAFTCFVGSIS